MSVCLSLLLSLFKYSILKRAGYYPTQNVLKLLDSRGRRGRRTAPKFNVVFFGKGGGQNPAPSSESFIVIYRACRPRRTSETVVPGALYVEGQQVKTGTVWWSFGEEAASDLLREERVERLRRFLHQPPDERVDAAHTRVVEMHGFVERLEIEHLERLS